jgi:RNA polymerase sigma-70 factor (ECF subfamily)
MLAAGQPCRGARLLPTAANGSPALAQYRPTSSGGSYEGFALVVLDVAAGRITDITTYLDAQRLFPLFDLPHRLER